MFTQGTVFAELLRGPQAKSVLMGEVMLPRVTSGKVKGHPGSHLSNILSRAKILLTMSYRDNDLFLIWSPSC